ncbi:MAG: hypothetical protein ND895_14615 [Pyrinomonadaceae bacterium]|nr:hypothetical protein [Pyrinomonadaceae bacterium]
MMTERIDTTKDAGGITVRIRSKKNWFILLFLPVWLTGWTFGGIAAITALVAGQNRDPILIVWLGGWAVGEALAICSWLWSAFGQEMISVRNGIFIHKRQVFGRGVSSVYPVNELFNLRASGVFGEGSMNSGLTQWGIAGGMVAVDTRYGDTYRFGIHLEEKDAVALAKALEPYLHRSIQPPLAADPVEGGDY